MRADHNGNKPKWRSSKNPEPDTPTATIFEFAQIGNAMRVIAVDEKSGVEVTIMAPLTSTQVQMEQVAFAKLQRRLALKS